LDGPGNSAEGVGGGCDRLEVAGERISNLGIEGMKTVGVPVHFDQSSKGG
jgi:hypothetical protein